MFRTLILDNFKAFGRRQVIPLAPITLVYGANSSGKSSILQSILLMKQTVSNVSTSNVLLVPRGELTDLGSFRDFVFQHELDRVVEISLVLSNDGHRAQHARPSFVRRGLSERRLAGGIGLRAAYDLSQQSMTLESLPVYLSDSEHPMFLWGKHDSDDDGRVGRMQAARMPAEFSSDSIRVKLESVNVEHPEWQRGFAEFSAQILPRIREIVDQLVSYFSELELEGQLEDFLRDSPRAFREAEAQRASGRHAQNSEVAGLAWHIARWYWDDDDPLTNGEYLGNSEEEDPSPQDARELPHILEYLRRQQKRYSEFTLQDYISDLARLSSERNNAIYNFAFFSSPIMPSPPSDPATDFVARLWRSLPHSTFRSHFDTGSLSQFLSNHLQISLESTIYLGPLREHPERHYVYSGNAASNVGKSGRQLPDVLFSRRELVEPTNEKLREFGVGYELDVRQLQDKDGDETIEDVFSLRLHDSQTRVPVSLMDVGFGVSQVLPVIVQSLMSENNTILIEQPEIHLHPRLQAELGTLLRDGIDPSRRNQFIVETHSEHLMLRIQRLIRRGDLNSHDVSAIYVSRDDDGSWCTQLRLDKDGDFIDEWPDGFFEEDYREVFGR